MVFFHDGQVAGWSDELLHSMTILLHFGAGSIYTHPSPDPKPRNPNPDPSLTPGPHLDPNPNQVPTSSILRRTRSTRVSTSDTRA